MNFTVNMLRDALAERSCRSFFPEGEDRAFRRVTFLPSDTAALNPDYLYVALLSHALEAAVENPGAAFLCLRDRFFRDTTSDAARLRSMLVVDEHISLVELFGAAQDAFFRVSEWTEAMNAAFLRGGTLQELLDLSEPILGNPVNICGPSLELLAATRGIAPTDRTSRLLLEHGCHPAETIRRFEKRGAFRRWRSAGSALEVLPEDGDSPTTRVCRSFFFQNTLFYHVVMVCDHVPYTEGLADLFRLFLDCVGLCAARDWEAVRGSDSAASAVCAAVLDGSLGGAELRARAGHAGLPLSGELRLLALASGSGGATAVERFGREIVASAGGGWLLRLRERPFLLLRDAAPDGAALAPLLAAGDLLCGESLPFSSLEALGEAVFQAETALHTAERTPPRARQRLVRFRTLGSALLLTGQESRLADWKHSYFGAMLAELEAEDAAHGTERLPLLERYLRDERRAARTGEALHMNRSNVAYHITRLEQLYGLELEDPDERLNLLLAFEMRRLYGDN